jgi:TonB family protein
VCLLVVLFLAPMSQARPPLTPASLLLTTDATHLDEPLLSSALIDPDPNVRAAGARLIAVFSVAPLAQPVAVALQKEADPRAGAELVRALLSLRGVSAVPVAQAAADRLGALAKGVVKTWQERNDAPVVSAVPNDLMFSRTVDVWLPGLLAGLMTAAKCRLGNEPQFGNVRVTYSRDGRPRRVEVDKMKLSKECQAVLAALGRTTVAGEDQAIADSYQQWVVVPFSRAFLRCTEQIDARDDGAVRPRSSPRKIKDVRPEYPREMRAQRMSGMVMATGWISTGGCLTNLQVTRSDGLPFELEALRAMSGWEFEPAHTDGRTLAVRTTVATTFYTR